MGRVWEEQEERENMNKLYCIGGVLFSVEKKKKGLEGKPIQLY